MKQKIIDYLKGRQDSHRFHKDKLIEKIDQWRLAGYSKNELARLTTNIEIQLALIKELEHIIITIQEGIE